MSVRIVRGQTPQQQADALARANLKQLEAVVVNAVQGKLHAHKMWLDKSDLEAAYNLGWHGVCQHIISQGEEVTNLTGFLIDITYKRAFDIYRQRHEGQHEDADLATRSANGDVVDQVDDQLKIQELIARMKRRLNENERKAVTLCLLHGFRRREAADMLGIEQAPFQRIMDSATKKLGGIAAEIDARGCAEGEWSRLLRSYALGLIAETDRDYPRAEKHVAECEACDRYVKGLKGLAAVMPPVGLPFMPMLGHEKAILAHLYRMFGGGHGGASGAAAAQTAGGTAGATSGGGTLVGSVSTSAAAKGVAVIAIAVVAVTIRSAHDAARAPSGAPASGRGAGATRCNSSGSGVQTGARVLAAQSPPSSGAQGDPETESQSATAARRAEAPPSPVTSRPRYRRPRPRRRARWKKSSKSNRRRAAGRRHRRIKARGPPPARTRAQALSRRKQRNASSVPNSASVARPRAVVLAGEKFFKSVRGQTAKSLDAFPEPIWRRRCWTAHNPRICLTPLGRRPTTAGASTQPLPRIEQTRPPRSAARPPAPASPRSPHAARVRSFTASRGLRVRGSAQLASVARRQARFLPAAIVVLVLLTHPVGCDRSTPTAPARRAAVRCVASGGARRRGDPAPGTGCPAAAVPHTAGRLVQRLTDALALSPTLPRRHRQRAGPRRAAARRRPWRA